MHTDTTKRPRKINDRVPSLLFFCFLLILAEGLTRLLAPDSLLDEVSVVLQRDPLLIWRQKPNLKVRFQNTDVFTDTLGLRIADGSTNKNVSRFKIVCLGASPTFGWGVQYKDTYPNRLQEALHSGQHTPTEVINGGEIGYSSYQGLLLLKNEIISLHPDLITVSYGLNDIDKYRFFKSNTRSDKELRPESPTIIFISNILSRSKFFRLLERVFLYRSNRQYKTLSNTGIIYYPGHKRVSPDDYRKNLLDFIAFCKARGIKIAFLKMPVNLPQAPLPETAQSASQELIENGLINLSQKELDEAINKFYLALKVNPYQHETYYYLGICFEAKRDAKRAKVYFTKAREKEAYRCAHDGLAYNAIMEKVAKEHSIPLIDVVNAFNKTKNGYLFLDPVIDPIHPNAAGHKIIGDEIYKVLTEHNLIPQH